MVYLWRAVDAEGEVLDVLIQSKRNKHAALKLMRKLLRKYAFVSERMITDDLRSCGAAAPELGIEDRHERGRWKNNRADNSHQPTRRRERKMQGFKSSRLRAKDFSPFTQRSQHLGKHSFHCHGIDSDGVIFSRKVSRCKLLETIKELAPETIAMEACASAHFWGRLFLADGLRVLLINPRFVKPFVKGSKNDAADAEGIYEAALRPTMRFIPVKSIEQQDLQSFIAHGSALSAPEPHSSIICGGFLASMASFYPKAHGAF